MDNKTLSAEIRTDLKKSGAKKVRGSGRIPAVIYGHNEPVVISVDEREFTNKFEKISENTIITINVDKNSYSVLVKDFQDDILTSKIQHIDFYEIEKGKTLKTNVPVHVEGSAKGVREGGLLDVRLHELEVECLPKDIPESVTVDVSDLEAGDAIHVADVPVPDGVKVLNMPEQTVVSVTLVKAEVEEAEGEEELEEGEASAETEQAEE
ncbi:MAG: 50S ribosomal protein L25 [Spirochaetales bacterium]|uniref:Large ribosomal subunit protein bL25 n=1 Tax=Candidatus Thalassospirochaeta sargassi TaxID=3119039 RepID=A0AAJ1MMX7_9SPIO|nr:50S ribosomal protein L25 [Spirochaetales bacterium]